MDELLYQEARRIVIAEVIPRPPILNDILTVIFHQFQNIAYKEYLPTIIGSEMMQEYDLHIGSRPTKYNPNIDPRVSNEFATVNLPDRLHF